MKTNEETTVSEEQVLFNKLNYEEQQFILKQMRMLQPCEIICGLEEEKKIPEKLDINLRMANMTPTEKYISNTVNEIIDYLKSKGE